MYDHVFNRRVVAYAICLASLVFIAAVLLGMVGIR
jgi:hypothetical protein